MTPNELRTKVAEAQHSVWMRDGVAWANETAEYRLIFTEMAETVLPLILDAAKEAVEALRPTEAFDAYDHGETFAIEGAIAAIDSLRNNP